MCEFLIWRSLTCPTLMPKILLILWCRNTSSLLSRDRQRCQISQPQRSSLYWISQKIMYLEYIFTWWYLHNLSSAPINSLASPIRLPTSKSPRRENNIQDPRYLNWTLKVTKPSDTTTNLISGRETYYLCSCRKFPSCNSCTVLVFSTIALITPFSIDGNIWLRLNIPIGGKNTHSVLDGFTPLLVSISRPNRLKWS